jgi:hypothetical protein
MIIQTKLRVNENFFSNKNKFHIVCLDRLDSSGIRFYLSDELRQHDLGYLTFGTGSSFYGLAIPPKMDQFIVDSYCPSKATQVDLFSF